MSDIHVLRDTQLRGTCAGCGTEIVWESGEELWCGMCGAGCFCETCFERHQQGWHYTGTPKLLDPSELARIVKGGLGSDEPGWGAVREDDWLALIEHVAAQESVVKAVLADREGLTAYIARLRWLRDGAKWEVSICKIDVQRYELTNRRAIAERSRKTLAAAEKRLVGREKELASAEPLLAALALLPADAGGEGTA